MRRCANAYPAGATGSSRFGAELPIAATAAALVAIAAAFALRRQRAAWRYAILLAAVLRFALPTPWLAQAGGMLVRYMPARPPAFDEIGRLLLRVEGAAPLPFRASPRRAPLNPLPILWAARSLGLRSAPELRIVSPGHAPGACGWLRPSILLPDGLSAALTAAELDAVLAHELAHIARRDNLAAAVVHAIVSVFWFHPLLWWMEHRLLAEREAACDELVLSRGARPEDYLSGILKVCRMAFAGDTTYAGINGSNLQRRMEYIMSADLTRRTSVALRTCAAAIFTAATLVPLAGGFLKAQQTAPRAQTPDEVSYQHGLTALREKKYQEAEESFRQADRLNHSNTRGLMGLVETYMDQQRKAEALALLQEQVDQDPTNAARHLALGNTAVRAASYDLAASEFRKALELTAPESTARADIYLRLGETYRRKGDAEAAIANLREARKIQPSNVIVLSTLGLVLEGAGNRDEAGALYRAVIDLEPNNGVALNNLAFLTSETGGDLDAALDLAARAKQALPNLKEIDDTIGWILLKKHDTAGALTIFRDLVQKSPENAAFHYHLALALVQNGQRPAAVQELDAALENKPTPADERKIKELLQSLGRF